MGQIINRRTAVGSLGTLADNTQVELDAIMEDLVHKAFLFEYRADLIIKTLELLDWFAEGGINIALIKGDLAASSLAVIIDGAQITDTDAHTDVPARQDLFALAEITIASVISSTDGYLNAKLRFKPSSKGGIPFTEGTGTGWKLVAINRDGSALTTGSLIQGVVYERFAYEGGS